MPLTEASRKIRKEKKERKKGRRKKEEREFDHSKVVYKGYVVVCRVSLYASFLR